VPPDWQIAVKQYFGGFKASARRSFRCSRSVGGGAVGDDRSD
jgi:hypothetical protein